MHSSFRSAFRVRAVHVIGKPDVHRVDFAAAQAVRVLFVAVGSGYFVFFRKLFGLLRVPRNESH